MIDQTRNVIVITSHSSNYYHAKRHGVIHDLVVKEVVSKEALEMDFIPCPLCFPAEWKEATSQDDDD